MNDIRDAVPQAPEQAASMGSDAVEMTWTPVNVFEKSISAAQDTYSPRFVAYLARFLVNYDRCGPKGRAQVEPHVVPVDARNDETVKRASRK